LVCRRITGSAQNIIPDEGNRHPEVVNYFWLALNTRNTVHHYCRYIHDSWFYRQDSMGDWEVAYHYLSYPRNYFPDLVKIPAIFSSRTPVLMRQTQEAQEKGQCRNKQNFLCQTASCERPDRFSLRNVICLNSIQASLSPDKRKECVNKKQ